MGGFGVWEAFDEMSILEVGRWVANVVITHVMIGFSVITMVKKHLHTTEWAIAFHSHAWFIARPPHYVRPPLQFLGILNDCIH